MKRFLLLPLLFTLACVSSSTPDAGEHRVGAAANVAIPIGPATVNGIPAGTYPSPTISFANIVDAGPMPLADLAHDAANGTVIEMVDGSPVFSTSAVGVTGLSGPVTGSGSGTIATTLNLNADSGIVPPLPIADLEAGAASTVLQTNASGSEVNAQVTMAEVVPCASGQIVETNGTAQTCTTVSGDLVLSNTGVATVQGVQNVPFSTTTPTNGQSWVFNSGTGKWTPTTGSGTSVTGTGIWYSLTGTLNAAAVQCGGDVTCTGSLVAGLLPFDVVKINGVTISGTPAAGNTLNATSSTAASWGALAASQMPTLTLTGAVTGAASGGTISTSLASAQLPTITLTGDTTGTGSAGSIATTTGKLNGNTLSTSGALTKGDVMAATSTTTWAQAAFSQDFTCSTSTPLACTVTQLQNGEVACSSSGVELWASGATLTLGQASTASVTPSPATISAQPSSNANGNAGAVILNSPVLAGTGTIDGTHMQYGGSDRVVCGALPGAPTLGACWFAAIVRTGSNFAFGGDGTSQLSINAPTAVNLETSASVRDVVVSGGFQVGNTGDLGGGVNVLGIDASTLPSTSLTAGDSVIGSDTNGIHFSNGANLNFAALAVETHPGLFLGIATPGVNTFAISSDGTNTVVNAPGSAGSTFIRENNGTLSAGIFSPNGVELFSGAGTVDFGGGVGVLGLGTATTSPTTPAATSGESVLSSETTGLYFDGASTGFVTQKVIPVFTGTENTQVRTIEKEAKFFRTTSESAVTQFTIPLPVANTCLGVVLSVIGRLSSGISQATQTDIDEIWCSNGISLTQGTPAVWGAPSATGSAGSAVFTSSGTNALIQFESAGVVTIDWTGQTTETYN